MKQAFRKNQWLLLLGDIVLILAATELASYIRFKGEIAIFDVHTGGSVFTLLSYPIMLYVFDLYNPRLAGAFRETVFRVVIATASSGLVCMLLFYIFPRWQYGRGVLLLQLSFVWVGFLLWRLFFAAALPMALEKEAVLILGAGNAGQDCHALLNNRNSPYRMVGFLDDNPDKRDGSVGDIAVIGSIRQLVQLSRQLNVKTAILAITHDRNPELLDRLLEARMRGIRIVDMTEVMENLTYSVSVDHLRKEWLIFADGFYLISKQRIQRVKRLVDIGVALTLLLVLWPIMVLTALLVRLESPGPALFRQKRMGFRGNVFTIFKFRSMRQDAEKDGAVWAMDKDPRITKVGRVIRKLRIDEFPQLINVLKGDMSIVGPRPERPEFITQLEKEIKFYAIRHAVRPGVTGWAQVNYPYGASVEDARNKLGYDLYYVKNMSLALDLKILLRTAGVMLFGQGAR